MSELFSSEHLLLGGPHCRGVTAGVVGRYEYMARLGQLFLRGHSEIKLDVLASSKVQRHGCRICTD